MTNSKWVADQPFVERIGLGKMHWFDHLFQQNIVPGLATLDLGDTSGDIAGTVGIPVTLTGFVNHRDVSKTFQQSLDTVVIATGVMVRTIVDTRSTWRAGAEG